MRWTLKNQILGRMALLLFVTVGAMTWAHIRTTVIATRARESERMDQVDQMLRVNRFPLTPAVLENMKLLSGAEFAVTDAAGNLQSRTESAPAPPAVGSAASNPPAEEEERGVSWQSEGRTWFYHRVELAPRPGPVPGSAAVHVFLPSQSWERAWWRASRGPLAMAALILPIAILIGLALANQVTRPLARFRRQVQRIAAGHRSPLPPSRRDDELQDLNQSINEMTEQLSNQEGELRQAERWQTLAELGSGVAHHLRNSATGCQMALELLSSDRPDLADSEELQVARRQLDLMNNYLNRFLRLTRPPSGSPDRPERTEPRDLAAILENVMFLLQPAARHLRVSLTWDGPSRPASVRISEQDGEQLIMNLVRNAITAASERAATTPAPPAAVEVELNHEPPGQVQLTVVDNGAGPPAAIADRLFEPFVSRTPEGSGLGLALVREVVERSGGEVTWERIGGCTRFVVRLPIAPIPTNSSSPQERDDFHTDR